MQTSQLHNVLGIYSYNDSKKEEMIYSLGKPHYMPISLFLSLMSSYKKSSFRIFNLVASTFSINSANLILPELNQDILDKMKEQFDSNYQKDYSFIKKQEPIDYSADYKEVELWNYVDMWNNFLNMATHYLKLTQNMQFYVVHQILFVLEVVLNSLYLKNKLKKL